MQSFPRGPDASVLTIYPHSKNPPCCICSKPVPLETSKTEEHGLAIHEECYFLKLSLQRATSDDCCGVNHWVQFDRKFTPRFNPQKREKGRSLMSVLLKRFWWEDEGQDVAEYAVMLAVILVMVVGTIRLVGSNSNNAFSSVASSLQ